MPVGVGHGAVDRLRATVEFEDDTQRWTPIGHGDSLFPRQPFVITGDHQTLSDPPQKESVNRSDRRLLEREPELTVLDALHAGLTAGRGNAVVLEGPAGIGKSALLDVLDARAGADGTRVLRARGGELERDDQFGVLQQLFGPPLPAADLGDLPFSAAAVAFGADGEAAPPGEDAARTAHFALFEICANLTREGPVLFVVDDAHWADDRSLRWLLFLARRLDRVPVGLAVARRPGEPGTERELLDRIVSHDSVRLLRLAPLSVAATEEVVREAMGAAAEPEFCAACQRATAGNPFLLRELLAELRTSGVEPTADAAEAALSVGPESVARATLLRLSRAPRHALALARALAVLEEAELRDVAALAEVDDSEASAAASALGKAGLLADAPRLRFAHPLVRSAVYLELDEHQRAAAHRQAARVLAAANASTEKVAAHLMLAAPACDPEAVASLQAAARRAYASGAPEAAATYLRRALAEPPPRAVRGEVLFELGRAEVRAVGPDAVEHLDEASALVEEGPARARVLRELARAHMRGGRMAEATASFEAAVECAGEERELLLALEVELAATLANVTGAGEAAARLAPYRGLAGETPAERSVLAVLAFASAQGNEPASVTLDLMDRALGRGQFVGEQTAATVVFADGIFALLLAGAERRALEALEPALADAGRLGWTIGLAAAPFYQAWAELRLGGLEAAKRHAEASLEVSDERGWQAFTPMAGAVLCETELERGELSAAADALTRIDLPDDVPDSAVFQLALYARGLLRARRRDPAAGLADLLLCGEREIALGGVTPAGMAWRSNAALLHSQLGEPLAALRLAGEELELARALGTPRAIGVALHGLALVEGGGESIDLLDEAVSALEPSGARLEHARALCALGAALRRANRRVDARRPLREALSLAGELKAQPLAERARAELLAAGGRPRRTALTGADALTASERRVAELAAAGRTNKEIAAELVVTVRTVEFHLSRAYGKLDIGSRADLAETLGRGAGRTADTRGE